MILCLNCRKLIFVLLVIYFPPKLNTFRSTDFLCAIRRIRISMTMLLFKNVPISMIKRPLGWMVSAVKCFLCLSVSVWICCVAIVMERNEILRRHLHARSQRTCLCSRYALTPPVLLTCSPSGFFFFSCWKFSTVV